MSDAPTTLARGGLRAGMARSARDGGIGLALFIAVMFGFAGDSPASYFGPESSEDPQTYSFVDVGCAAAAFSALFAVNIALWRHLTGMSTAVSPSEVRRDEQD